MTTTITIKRNDYDEYEVPAGINSHGRTEIYFTDDRQDAIDTARAVYGAGIIVNIVAGSYDAPEI